MKRVFLLSFTIMVTLLLYACNEKGTMQPEVSDKEIAMKTYADSLQNERLKKLHNNFVGKHAHQQSLAVHAHQDIPGKTRLLRNAGKKSRISKKVQKNQKEKQIEMLKARGIYKDS